MGFFKKVTVKVSELVDGPIRHKNLPPKVLADLKTLYDEVGQYSCPTLEQWEIGFMRDARPEREIAIWQHVATAWKAFESHYNGIPLSYSEKRACANALVAMTLGIGADQAMADIKKKRVTSQLRPFCQQLVDALARS